MLARTHACTHARTYARMHARTHAHMHACTHARTHARAHAGTRARRHARMHARTHTRTYVHARTHARTHPRTHARRPACGRCARGVQGPEGQARPGNHQNGGAGERPCLSGGLQRSRQRVLLPGDDAQGACGQGVLLAARGAPLPPQPSCAMDPCTLPPPGKISGGAAPPHHALPSLWRRTRGRRRPSSASITTMSLRPRGRPGRAARSISHSSPPTGPTQTSGPTTGAPPRACSPGLAPAPRVPAATGCAAAVLGDD